MAGDRVAAFMLKVYRTCLSCEVVTDWQIMAQFLCALDEPFHVMGKTFTGINALASHDVASELLLHEVREVVVHALPFHRMHMRVVRVRMLIHKVLVYLGHGLALQPVLSAGSLFVNYPAHCLCIALREFARTHFKLVWLVGRFLGRDGSEEARLAAYTHSLHNGFLLHRCSHDVAGGGPRLEHAQPVDEILGTFRGVVHLSELLHLQGVANCRAVASRHKIFLHG
mmetsp:Transcript_48244/g.92211  ORF Transcript_48244/g.92211 Transcript_48244/m.92211 type:complete len:226 (-) Transcript_48244:3177-3854(-)